MTNQSNSLKEYMTFSVLIRLITAVMLLIGATKMPYDYYSILRLAVSATSGYMIYLSVNQQKGQWAVFWIALLILFNPVAPVGLKKDTWVVLDIIAGIAVAASTFSIRESGKTN
jgi:hypothetical protein